MAYNTADDIMSKLDDIANDIMNLTIRVNRIDNALGHGVIDIMKDKTNLSMKKNSEKNSQSQSLDKVLESTEDPFLVEM
jgi:ribulose bisphosphate carboxylase small subunit|tara:strand:- start:1830 stop:2066 length:237 start_codon:yes stop_codon:yes gene_type:complete